MFCQYLSLDLPQVPHKNIHKRRRDAGEACKKVKRQKLYEYTFIISTGYNVRTMSKLLQDYSNISCLCTSNSLSQMYTLNVERFTIVNQLQNVRVLFEAPSR